jgi:hypothetical protein
MMYDISFYDGANNRRRLVTNNKQVVHALSMYGPKKICSLIIHVAVLLKGYGHDFIIRNILYG